MIIHILLLSFIPVILFLLIALCAYLYKNKKMALLVTCLVIFYVIIIITDALSAISSFSKDELRLISNHHCNELMKFKSQNGDIDSVSITEVYVKNYNFLDIREAIILKPLHSTVSIYLDYYHNGNIAFGVFSFTKIQEKIYLQSEFNERCTGFLNINFPKNGISKQTVKDIITIDESNSNMCTDSDPTKKNYIVSYTWSLKHGLVKYVYKDGTTYTRIDIK